jgi:hypothetical protein
MTVIQTCALIGLIAGAILVYWVGYRNGMADGRYEGREDGKNTERAENAKTICELRASLDFIKADHTRLAQFSKRLQQTSEFGETERQTLIDIAEKLRIAAETFAAFRTGKKLERETRALQDQALALAALLQTVKQGDAA